MSADDFPNYHAASGVDDPYATRPMRMPEVATPDEKRREGRSPQRRRRSPLVMVLDGLLILLIVFVFVAGGMLYYFDRSYQGKIYPNVTVQGMRLGEMTPEQAEATIRARYADFLRQPVTLTYDGRTWQPSADEIGMRFDFNEAASEAYRAGRGNGLIANLQEINSIWNNGLELPLHATIDAQKIQAYVSKISAQYNVTPVDASLTLNGITVTTTLEQAGRQVLVDETTQGIMQALQTWTPQTVDLRTRELTPRLHDDEVAAAKQRIESFVQGPFTMHVKNKDYKWTAEDVARMLTIGRVAKDDATDRMVVDVNPYFIDRQVRKIMDETGRGSVNPRVAWNGGNLKIIKAGSAGWKLNEDGARKAILASLNTSQRDITLPTDEIQPTVNEFNLNSLGINELISVGRSDFSGSAAYRIQNIGVGMNILSGILVGPGEEFSFNQNIGEIDERNGFVQGYAIVQNRTQLEFGGGICQDSTTMYRAAFWAGFPITERWGHSFYINWYDKYAYPNSSGPGMDATIFTGGPDLRFLNDTGHWILIQSYSNPSTAVAEVAIYGTKPNRTVTATSKIYDRKPAPSEPTIVYDKTAPPGSRKQTDTARGGMTIDVYRTITENGVQHKPEVFRTIFKAWPNIFVVGPSVPKPAPAPEQPAPEQPAPEQPANG